MKRYGDNVTSSSISEDEVGNKHDGYVRVMYGGCGVRFGAFQRPITPPQKRKTLDLLSLLGFRENKEKGKSD